MNKQVLILVPAVILIAGGSFFGGFQVGKTQSKSDMPNFQNLQNRQGMANQQGIQKRTGNVNGGFVNGQILSLDNGTLTLKVQTGGSKIILISDSTKILKSTEGSNDDLIKDENVMITGKTNTDGTVTADTIQIRSASNAVTVPPVAPSEK